MATTPAGSSVEEGRIVLARLDRIPGWPLPWTHLVVVGIGYFFNLYNLADVGWAVPVVAARFNVSGSGGLLVATAVGIAGYVVGSILLGGVADRAGRVPILLAAMGIIAVGCLGDAASNSLFMLAGFRFITGVGIGADLNLISTYISELSPAPRRGRVSALTLLVGVLGQSLTPFLALAHARTPALDWRWLFVIGGVIAVITLLVRLKLPESPRWLVQHGHIERARELVERMETSVQARGVQLPEPDPSAAEDEGTAFSFGYLRQPPYLQRLYVLVAMWFLWYLGNYGFLANASSLLGDRSYDIVGSIPLLVLGAAGYPLGAILMAVLADRAERNRLIFGATVVWLVGMALIGTVLDGVLVAAGVFLGSFGLGLFLQVAYTYTAENFPTRARSSGFAISDGVGHLGGLVGALALPTVVAATSFQFGFVGIGVTGLAAGVLALAGPRATARRLESMSG